MSAAAATAKAYLVKGGGCFLLMGLNTFIQGQNKFAGAVRPCGGVILSARP
jgi:hypothetical protein